MKDKKNLLFVMLALFICSLPMAVSFAKYYEEVSLQITSAGSRPAIQIEKIGNELYHDRNKTMTYQFRVKNSDAKGQSQVKLQYTLEFHMPISTGITYSLKNGNTNVPLTEAGTTVKGKKIFSTTLQSLPAGAQTDTWTLSATNSGTRSISILDTMKIILHAQQPAN